MARHRRRPGSSSRAARSSGATGLFENCGYRKSTGSCANPEHQPDCPLPRHDLRNGRLNQTAYSLFLFMRDLADGDIVGWIDDRLADVDPAPASDRPARLRQALLEPLGHVYGVSNKVLAMALSELLLAGDAKRPAWIEAGTVMIAVDTLVHNFLHRTGILRDLDAEHPYGLRLLRPRRLRRDHRAHRRQDRCAPLQSRLSRPISRASSSTRFGGFAPKPGSTAATAAASMIARRASRPTARFSRAAVACRSSRRKLPILHAKRELIRAAKIMLHVTYVPDMFILPRLAFAGRGGSQPLTTGGLQHERKSTDSRGARHRYRWQAACFALRAARRAIRRSAPPS